MAGVIRDRLILPDDPEARGRAWQDHIAPVFDIGFGRDTDLSAPLALELNLCGEMVIGSVDAPVQRLTRTPRKIAQQGLDHVLLQFYETGASSVQGRGTTPVAASKVVVFDMSQPVEIEAGAVRALNLIVPRRVLVDPLGNIDHLHGQAFDFAADPVRRMLHGYMRGLLGTLDRVEPHQAVDLSEAAAALCRACLPRGRQPEPPGSAVRKLAIKQYVEERIGAPELDIARVVERFGVSRPTLQRLFEEEGGFASYVRERRLQRAFASLAQGDDAARQRVSAVAYAHGFTDVSTFSRAFQRRFGFAPRDAMAGAGASESLPSDHTILMSFLNRL